MKKLHFGKRGLALLLSLVLLATMLPTSALAEETTPAGAPAEGIEGALNADTVYYKVAFALPEGLSEEEAAEIALPEPVLLPAGTLLYAVAEPVRPEYQFAGWYYDAALTQPADGGDAVERNLTLYPSFAPIQNFDDEFRINYISAQDVEPDFAIEVAAHGLNEAQVRERLKVTDLSKVDGAEEFVLERLAPDMAALIPDEETRALALDAAQKAQSGELEGGLTEALAALTVEGEGDEPVPALDDAVIADVVAYYAPDEAKNTEAMMAADLIHRVEDAGLDPKNVTLADLMGVMTEEELARAGLADTAGMEGLDEAAVDLEDEFAELLEIMPTAHYIVRPVGGNWRRGDMHQVEILDTGSLRFFRDGEEVSQYVVYYNITVHQDDFNNMKLNSGVVFLPYAEVEGVTLDGGLFKVDAENDSDDMTVTPNDESGVLTYAGDAPVKAGCTVAVYDGILHDDGTVDGSVGYFKIVEALGDGRYAFESPEFTDVIFLPDIIPARDDGSFDDGEILLTADQLDFTGEVCAAMGLNEDTVVEPGDFVAVYTGSLDQPDGMALTGYGCVTAVEPEGDGLLVRYDAVSEETLLQSSDMFMHVDNIPVPLTEEELEEVGSLVEQDVMDSGFLEDSAEYIKDLIIAPEEAILPDSKYSDALTGITFQREDGSEISLAEVRELAGGSRVEVEWPPNLSFLVGLTLQHFEGTGLRGEMAAEMTITIKLNDNANIKITVVAMIEVEVALGLHIKWNVDWRRAWIFPYIYDIGGAVGLHAGIYVGAGITVTVRTVDADKPNDQTVDGLMSGYAKDAKGNYKFTSDKQNSALKFINKVGSGLESIAKISKAGGDGLHLSSIPGLKSGSKNDKGEQTKPDAETDEMHNTVGGSFEEKYSNFIQGSDAKYVTLVNRNLAKFELPADPLHIVALSLGINFVVKFKLNVMLGVSITYGNAKQITATFTIFHPHSESTCGDLETPNFQVDFFIFGMVGIRVGFEFDFAIGVISTSIASLGITAEIGIYLEFYGYFYIAYKWESGKGSHTEMFGSLLVQFGLYLDIDFKMQMGAGQLEKRFDIYDVRWPLLSLGDEFCALDFEIEDDDEKLNLNIEKKTKANAGKKSTDTNVIGGASIKVPDELFDIKFLEIDTGEIDSDNMDRNVAVGGSSSFKAMGVTYTQKDERNFHVVFTPKGKNFTAATAADKAKGAFLYDPITNNIYAKPNSLTDTELWGEFTFTWYQGEPAKTKSALNFGAGFGLNTRKIERKVRVHWTGTPVKGTADIYLCNERGKGLSDDVSFEDVNGYYTKKDTLDFDGLEGVLYYMDLQGLADRYPGYTLYAVKETYDDSALNAYIEMKLSKGQVTGIYTALRELARALVYDYEYVQDDPSSRGWLLVDPTDTAVYCMMHPPKTEVKMYFDFSEAEADWHILDEKGNSDKPLLSVYAVKYSPGYNALDAMPAAIKAETNRDPGYEYHWYMVPTNSLEPNIRDPKTNRVIYLYGLKDGEYDQYRGEDGLVPLVIMPAFSEVMGDRSKWIAVTEETKLPHANTLFFALRVPRTYTVTWKYEDGDMTTQVRYGEAPVAPKEATRKKFDFAYWSDAKGKKYPIMPANDLTLIPNFTGKIYTVTWFLDGASKTSEVRAGDNPLEKCPFKAGNYAVNWTTTRGDILTTVGKEYEMPAKSLKLYGMYVYKCDWLLYDTGNGKYTALNADVKYQTKKKGDVVLDNLPEEVSQRLADDRYTYSYFYTYERGEKKVEAQRSKWKTVDAKTQYDGRDSTYILQRSPVMVNVTWKYDDGDVTTSCWVGRKLAAPKEISRKGYVFTGWADADGNAYEYPPQGGVTLYPQFTDHEHAWDGGTVSAPATCAATGTMTYTCTDCGKTRTETIAIDPENHTGKTEVRNAKDATCTEEGYSGDTYCLDCGKKIADGEAIAKLAHTPGAAVRENEIAATCAKEGSYDEVVYCTVCDAELSREAKTIAKLTTHTPGAAVRENEIAATCAKEGSYDEVVYCTICETELSRAPKAIEKDPENHTGGTEIRNAREAACEEEGYTGDTYCKGCGQKLASGTAIDAIGHAWGEPSWGWVGYGSATATFNCANDSGHEKKLDATISMERTEPTAEADGSEVYTAAVTLNGKTYTDEKTVTLPKLILPKLGSELTTEDGAPAFELAILKQKIEDSQTIGGLDPAEDLWLWAYTGDSAIAENSEEVAATLSWAEDYGEVRLEDVKAGDTFKVHIVPDDSDKYAECDVTLTIIHEDHVEAEPVQENVVPATCKAVGSYDEVVYCTVCGAELSREAKSIDKLAHTPGEAVRENEVAATCEGEGSYDEVVYCTVCETELSREAKTTAALGHDWGEWVETKPPTETENGEEQRVCTRDETHIEIKTVPMLGHTHTPGEPVQENVVPATCKVVGSYDEVVYCSGCETELSREAKSLPIDPNNHNFGEWLTKAPEPVFDPEGDASGDLKGYRAGYKYKVCSDCDTTVNGDPVKYQLTISPAPGEAMEIPDGDDTVRGRIDLLCTDVNLIATYGDKDCWFYAGDDFICEITSCSVELNDQAADHVGETIDYTIRCTPNDTDNYETVIVSYGLTITSDEPVAPLGMRMAAPKAQAPEPNEGSEDESRTEPADEAFSGSVRVELKNKGKVYEGDKAEFKAVIDGDETLVSIHWQKLVEVEIGEKREWRWVDVAEGEKFAIQATEANAAEKYRVVLIDADGEACAEAGVTFPTIHKKEDPAPESQPEAAPAEHAHAPGGAVRENETPATCDSEGGYDEVVYCTDCGEELSRTRKTIDRLERPAPETPDPETPAAESGE